jgi:hypothetical protein
MAVSVFHARAGRFYEDAETIRQLRSRLIEILNVPLRFPEIEVLEGFFRSPKSIIEWANGLTKCGRYLLRFRFACGLAGRTV